MEDNINGSNRETKQKEKDGILFSAVFYEWHMSLYDFYTVKSLELSSLF